MTILLFFFWLNVNDEVSIQQSFTRIAGRILNQPPTTSQISTLNRQKGNNKAITALKAWLNLPHNTKWLLICDNHDNPTLNSITKNRIDINCYLPIAFQGSIIITTRVSFVDIGHQIPKRKLESLDDGLAILASNSRRRHLHDGE